MNETYTALAQGIIRDSIRSVIFVDDELALPFDEEATEPQRQLSSGIYSSFMNNDSGLDFYRFQAGDNWEVKKEYFFNGRDLLVIDWQLDADHAQHRNTLKILKEAINRPSLHFICIYTSTEIASFNDILYQIAAYFSVVERHKAEMILNIIRNEIGDEDEQEATLGQEFQSKCKELVLYSNRTETLTKEVRTILFKSLAPKTYGKDVKSAYQSESEALIAIGAILNDVLIGEGNNACDVTVHANENFIKINDTLIVLMNKEEVKSTKLYEKFSEAVIKSSKNFLTLLGLEMRNLYHSGSSFIGKDIDSINELAFFYHQRQSHPQEAFTEFLSDLCKNQSFNFLYNKDTRPKLLDYLPKYIIEEGLEAEIESYPSNPNSISEMGWLNFYYNILRLNRIEGDNLRFGDIFQLIKPDQNPPKEYLLCITAHCDCLYTDKIQNMFYFIKGVEYNLTEALNEGDTGHNSYIVNNGKVESIRWSDKPFTLYIPPNMNNIDANIPITLAGKDFHLSYHSTIKENYAQRMANRAASYPLRVGIFFADFKNSAQSSEPAVPKA